MAKGEYDDAVENLKKSVEIASRLYEQDHSQDTDKLSNPGTNILINIEELCNKAKIYLSKCYLHHKEYQEAIDIVN
ncbi:MAG: hypothetical protein E6Q33_05830 [Neisseriales bacterium]|nr:MAG: hypothetical protein E6Q33_05830 [Neisseriales bacterium]